MIIFFYIVPRIICFHDGILDLCLCGFVCIELFLIRYKIYIFYAIYIKKYLSYLSHSQSPSSQTCILNFLLPHSHSRLVSILILFSYFHLSPPNPIPVLFPYTSTVSHPILAPFSCPPFSPHPSSPLFPLPSCYSSPHCFPSYPCPLPLSPISLLILILVTLFPYSPHLLL